jgi:hypothetical protein
MGNKVAARALEHFKSVVWIVILGVIGLVRMTFTFMTCRTINFFP